MAIVVLDWYQEAENGTEGKIMISIARRLAASALLIAIFALVVMIYHRLGLIGWYGGKINGGVWFGPARHFVGLELWGHFGVFHDVN